jgi:deoxyribonuclease-2
MLQALNDAEGKPVDWWFMYKLPEECEIKGKSGPVPDTGFGYLYYDCDGQNPAISSNLLGEKKGALYDTLQQLFGPGKANDTGWILYNDEIPGAKSNDGTKGHTKGVLAFNKDDDSAFWLLHSTPRFPHPGDALFPDDEKIYGQTFICITLKDYDTAEQLAGVMRAQQEPQVYGCRIPDSIPIDSNIFKLSKGEDIPAPAEPADLTFYSRGGKEFHCLAKNRHWGKDFWIDLVGPTLKVDLDIETWRRGTVPPTQDSDKIDDVKDVLYVNLQHMGLNYEWHYTKDHSKWAVSDKTGGWVCVADINRMTSQEKRGGGAVCFQEPNLQKPLRAAYQLKK